MPLHALPPALRLRLLTSVTAAAPLAFSIPARCVRCARQLRVPAVTTLVRHSSAQPAASSLLPDARFPAAPATGSQPEHVTPAWSQRSQVRPVRTVTDVSFLSSSVSQTHRIASYVAPLASAGTVILLHGAVGSGKSEFARGFLRAFTSLPALIVASPTFALMVEYQHNGCSLHHIDLYRLESPEQTAALPLQRVFAEDISLVEWAERLPLDPALLSSSHVLQVRIEKTGGGGGQPARQWDEDGERLIRLECRRDDDTLDAALRRWRREGVPGVELWEEAPQSWLKQTH